MTSTTRNHGDAQNNNTNINAAQRGLVPRTDTSEADRIENTSTATLIDEGGRWFRNLDNNSELLLLNCDSWWRVSPGTVLFRENGTGQVIAGRDYISSNVRGGCLEYGILREHTEQHHEEIRDNLKPIA